jgi:DNA-directed RNA polymerase subunit RPC12/RpoP
MVTHGSNKKVWWKCKKGHEWQSMILSRSKGNGCPYCSGRYSVVGETDLCTTHPQLIEEWNYEKNAGISPTDLTKGSGKKIWWKCQTCGHEWVSAIKDRSNGHGCPKCARKRPKSR